MKRLGTRGMQNAAALSAGLLVTALGACGQDTGYLYEDRTIQQPAATSERPAFDLTESLYHSVTWLNHCPSAPMTPPTRGPLDPIIVGAGPHALYRTRLIDVPFVLMGKVCPARTYDRDVVVMVGISGASRLIDRFNGTTCQRFQALENILNELPAGSKMGVATFEETVRKSSTNLFNTKDELYNDLAGSTDPVAVAKIVCGVEPADAGGPTNFNVAFEKGKELLGMGRGNETKKELILIADGYNDGGAYPPVQARLIRQEITVQGIDIGGQRIPASVGTLILGSGIGDANKVHEFSTNDRAGQPLRGDVAQAANVTRAIGSIAANNVVSNVLRLRPIGARSWVSYDAMPHMTGLEFSLPSVILPIDLTQAGFEMEGEYSDTHGNRTVYNGRIEWADGRP